jgi:hypothetical protein
MKISQENLEKVRQANIGNILKKVKAGKVLSAHEQKLLDAQKEEKPEKATTKTRKVAQSMKQAHAFWGIPISIMKAAKAAGCDAFVEHRVHRDELLQWVKNHPETGKSTDDGSSAEELKRKKLLNEVALLQIKVAREDETVIDCGVAKAEWARCMAIVQEEARNLINDDDKYRIFCERIQARIGQE